MAETPRSSVLCAGYFGTINKAAKHAPNATDGLHPLPDGLMTFAMPSGIAGARRHFV